MDVAERPAFRAHNAFEGTVAITSTCALSLLRLGPLCARLVLSVIAVCIVLGAVPRRYHYPVEAIRGESSPI